MTRRSHRLLVSALATGLLAVASTAQTGGSGGSVIIKGFDRYVAGGLGFKPTLAQGDRLGESCVELGDVNRDGNTDVAVAKRGAVYVLLLGKKGEVLSVGGTITVAGELRVEALGDLNRDGVPDLAVGARAANRGGGAVYIYFLSKTGTVASTKVISSPVRTNGFGHDLAKENTTSGVRLAVASLGATGNGDVTLLDVTTTGTVTGNPAFIRPDAGALKGKVGSGERFGASVAFYQDLDSDGQTEVLVGAPGGKGAVWLLHQSGGVVKTTPAPARFEGGRYVLRAGCAYGATIRVVGDLDGDGRDEALVGAPLWRATGDQANGILFLTSFARHGGEMWDIQKVHQGMGGLPASFGGFTSGLPLPIAFGTGACTIADRDGNGLPELLVGAPGTNGTKGDVYQLGLCPARAHGFAVTGLGKGLTGRDATAQLVVSNIGSSGQDGVRIADFGDASGMRLQGEFMPGARVGDYTEISAYGAIGSKKDTLIESTRITRTGKDSVRVSLNFVPQSAGTYEFELWRGRVKGRGSRSIIRARTSRSASFDVSGTPTSRGNGYQDGTDLVLRKRPGRGVYFGGDVTVTVEGEKHVCDEVWIYPASPDHHDLRVNREEMKGVDQGGGGGGGRIVIRTAALRHGDLPTWIWYPIAAGLRVTANPPQMVRLEGVPAGGGSLIAEAPPGVPLHYDIGQRMPDTRSVLAEAIVNGKRTTMVDIELVPLSAHDRITPSLPGWGSGGRIAVRSAGREVYRGTLPTSLTATPVSGPPTHPDFVFMADGAGMRYFRPHRFAFGSTTVTGDTVHFLTSATARIDDYDCIKTRHACKNKKQKHRGHVTVLKLHGGAPQNDVPGVGQTLARTFDGTFCPVDDGRSGMELHLVVDPQGNTRRVADIRPGALGSNPRNLVTDGERVFFVANNGTHGEELWVSNGTAQGTVMLADIATGPRSSGVRDLTVQKDWRGTRLWFVATDLQNGTELWTSDTTPKGTRMVANIHPSGSSNPRILGLLRKGHDAWCMLAANDGRAGEELWSVDSRSLRAAMVADINPGPGSSSPRYSGRGDFVWEARLGFFADNGKVGREPFVTDGKTATLLGDVRKGTASSNPGDGMVDHQGRWYFAADDGVHGRECWATDFGMSRVFLAKDIRPGPQGSNPRNFGLHRPGVCLGTWGRRTNPAYFAADDGTHGEELWGSDGTSTLLIHDLVPGPASSSPSQLSWIGGGHLFLRGSDGLGGHTNYWIRWQRVNQPPRPDCKSCIEDGGAWLCRWKNNDWWCHCMKKIKPALTSLGIAPDGSGGGAVMVGRTSRGPVITMQPLNGLSRAVGVGSFGMSEPPVLLAQDGRIGRVVEFTGRATPGARATIYLSIPNNPLPFGFGRFLYFNPILLVSLGAQPVSSTGEYGLKQQFPNMPSLLGVSAAFQALVSDAAGNYAVSNGIHMVVGR